MIFEKVIIRMSHHFLPYIKFLFPGTRTYIILDITWLVVIPVGIWVVVSNYVPIMSNLSSGPGPWLVAALVALMAAISLAAHLAAHLVMARMTASPFPEELSLQIFGDAAQTWPSTGKTWKEFFISFSSPLVNLLLAGLAYLVWNAQFNEYLNLSALFICFFNIWLGIVNLAPVFPLDGGRLARSLIANWIGRPDKAAWAVRWLGLLVIVIQFCWGIYLIVPQYQYSLETGIITFFCALIFLAGWAFPKTWDWKQAGDTLDRSAHTGWLRSLAVGLVMIAFLALPSGLLLTNGGIEAPGVALSVESMVSVPAQYQHPISGTFILTSVLSQEPIPAAGWAAAKLIPTIALIPPQKKSPDQASPQEFAQQGFQMLNESEITAEVVALKLAGFPAQIVGEGASVVSVLADSPSYGKILPGDVITAVAGKPVQTAADLANLIEAQGTNRSVNLQIERGGKVVQISTDLIPPSAPGDTPKLGITIQTAGFNYKLPFSVQINPQKIVGGPSAGLMFTLTLYNMLTPQDLTGGYRIAGTGTINPDGSVGPIGGVKQKVAAAEAAGAVYFLAPVNDYPDAVSVARHIKVIEIGTAEQAIQFLQSLPPK